MNKSSIRAFSGAAALLLSAHPAGAQLTTVGAYNPLGRTITDAASNTVTLAQFTADVTSAFTANQGGVVNFDDATAIAQFPGSATPFNFSATYGTSQSNTLTVSPGASGAIYSVNNNAAISTISGANYFGQQTAGNTFLGFSTPLSEFGITVTDRASGRNVTFAATLDDASVVTFGPEATSNAVYRFFGYKAPTGRTIASVALTSPDGFFRMDDMGFVTAAAVPESSSGALLLSVGILLPLGIFLRRRTLRA